MVEYLYLCAECFQFFDNVDNFFHHGCQTNAEGKNPQEVAVPQRKEVKITINDPGSSVVTESSCSQVAEEIKNVEKYVSPVEDSNDTEGTEDEAAKGEGAEVGKKRKKYHAMADEYRVNRIMRDKDFKLDRTHLYSFKDTLGDWDDRSTKLLINLIQKYPKCHFLLPARAERRLMHWESIHHEMEMAGYTFTVLQLRMRWREVLQKYRWTVDYNDRHEIKKKCEFLEEMNELFGNWDKEAIQCLLKQMHQLSLDNQKKKILRIGYAGWDKITSTLNEEGHRFTIDMVEARWRNMVTLYKTMIDHNALPNMEPRHVAYEGDLDKILKYIPKRRQTYEKFRGRSVTMERFPAKGVKVLLQIYKDFIDNFIDPTIQNAEVWDEIKQKLEEEGHVYPVAKLKAILNGIIKGFEKTQRHNSLPGAIRRDVAFYRELSEIYGMHGRWPHIKVSRKSREMATGRKFRLRLQASQQLWSLEESKALLKIYPDILEAHVNQNVSHQASDLWLQVAKAYAASGFPKRDVPEIAIHIGLLRMGYAQGNLFPFVEEMQKIRETEEAVCYSPDVSKFTGDVEVIYWSHGAVNHLLELYLKHQPSVSSHSGTEVFAKMKEDMHTLGYCFTKDEISDHFRTLIVQHRTKTSKPWGETVPDRKTFNPTGAPYHNMLEKVVDLRRKLCLSWTNDVWPLDDEALCIVYKAASLEAVELFQNYRVTDEKRMISQLIEQVQSHIRRKKLLKQVPKTRQIRVHLVSALRRCCEKEEKNPHVTKLHEILKDNNMDDFFKSLKCELKQDIPVSSTKTLKRPRGNQKYERIRKKQRNLEGEEQLPETESIDDLLCDTDSHSTSSPFPSQAKSQNESDSTDGYSSPLTRCTPDSHESLEAIVSTKEVHLLGNYLGENGSELAIDCKNNTNSSFETALNSNEDGQSAAEAEKYSEKSSSKILFLQSKVTGKTNSCIKPKVSSSNNFECTSPKEGCEMECEDLGITEKDGIHTSCSPSEREEIKTKINSKIIHTRSGRKTRFTFFTKALLDPFDDDSYIDEPQVVHSSSLNIEHEDKIVNSEVIVPLKRKRGRPRKSNEPSLPTSSENVENRKVSGRKTHFTFFAKALRDPFDDDSYIDEPQVVHSGSLNIEHEDKIVNSEVIVPLKRKRGRPRKSYEPSLPTSSETVENRKVLSKSRKSTNKNSNVRVDKRLQPPVRPISTVFSDENAKISAGNMQATWSSDRLSDSKNCSVNSAMEAHKLKRIEEENTLFSILEKYKRSERAIAEQMLSIFEGLESTLSMKSTI